MVIIDIGMPDSQGRSGRPAVGGTRAGNGQYNLSLSVITFVF